MSLFRTKAPVPTHPVRYGDHGEPGNIDPDNQPHAGQVWDDVGNEGALSGIADTSRLTDQLAGQDMPARVTAKRGGMPRDMLANFRANHPFVPVYPLPYEVQSLVLSGASPGDPQDIQVPDSAIAVAFTYSKANDVYINLSGVAQAFANLDKTTMVNPPPGFLFYCYGKRTISCFGGAANTVITAYFFIQDSARDN